MSSLQGVPAVRRPVSGVCPGLPGDVAGRTKATRDRDPPLNNHAAPTLSVGSSPRDKRHPRNFWKNSAPRPPQKPRQSAHLLGRPTPMIDAPGRLMLGKPKHAGALDLCFPGSMLPNPRSEKTGSIVHGAVGRGVPGAGWRTWVSPVRRLNRAVTLLTDEDGQDGVFQPMPFEVFFGFFCLALYFSSSREGLAVFRSSLHQSLWSWPTLTRRLAK